MNAVLESIRWSQLGVALGVAALIAVLHFAVLQPQLRKLKETKARSAELQHLIKVQTLADGVATALLAYALGRSSSVAEARVRLVDLQGASLSVAQHPSVASSLPAFIACAAQIAATPVAVCGESEAVALKESYARLTSAFAEVQASYVRPHA